MCEFVSSVTRLVLEWSNGGMARMAEWRRGIRNGIRNGGRNGRMAEWQNSGNGGMEGDVAKRVREESFKRESYK